MALARSKRTTTIILDSTMDRLLARAAREQGISRSEFIRRQLRRVLEQYQQHPKPRSAGVIKGPLPERGDEDELFRDLEALSLPALICDTGALLDYLVASSPDHAAFRAAIDAARTRYVPGLVLAELDYFLRKERRAMRAFIEDIRRGAFLYVPPTDAQLSRAMLVDAEYVDLHLGLVDATIVALAEELDVVRLATRDIRHFSAVRLADGRAFELVVIPGTEGSRTAKV